MNLDEENMNVENMKSNVENMNVENINPNVENMNVENMNVENMNPITLPKHTLYTPRMISKMDKNLWSKELGRFTTKDETSSLIINFIKAVQVQLKLPVQTVRTDNGTEFKNTVLKSFYNSFGITQTFSAARTPEQNGVVERRTRTLVEAARSMLAESQLPQYLWAEAVNTACY
ncbi:hypothetical protein OSB04_028481 [Centaurea solstitialis]|uniref:Integrase catalytic domain-containing protein n=1 Tax=Centaurea solstitialis TaxID=347529 RepID=A0AA38ST98_9ASTR|nr:hypothetical protein OSB04_028481 [Centaurea solstitialis]